MFSQLTVSAQLHLNPSDRSGAFITMQKSWSVLPAPDVNISYDGQGLTFQVVLQKPAGETFIQQQNEFAVNHCGTATNHYKNKEFNHT